MKMSSDCVTLSKIDRVLKTTMTLMLFVAVMSLSSGILAATSYQIDETHSEIGFKVKHLLVSSVKGWFDDYSGKLIWDDEDVSKCQIEGKVSVASIQTKNERRDNHLRSPDFFNAKIFPNMTFTSTKITKTDQLGVYQMKGDLRIKGITKPVSSMLFVTSTVTDQRGRKHRGFETELKINRKDYNIQFNKRLADQTPVVSEKVMIQVMIEGVTK